MAQKKIPTSTISFTTINIKADEKLGQPGVLFYDSTCMITTLNGAIHTIFVQQGFHPDSLPMQVRHEALKAPAVHFSPKDQNGKEDYIELPDWVSNMQVLKFLIIQGGMKGGLQLLKQKKLTTLVIYDILPRDKPNILNEIVSMRQLEYFVCNSLSQEEINYIKKRSPKLNILNIEEFQIGIQKGEIPFQ